MPYIPWDIKDGKRFYLTEEECVAELGQAKGIEFFHGATKALGKNATFTWCWRGRKEQVDLAGAEAIIDGQPYSWTFRLDDAPILTRGA